jgi:hypothetical protein
MKTLKLALAVSLLAACSSSKSSSSKADHSNSEGKTVICDSVSDGEDLSYRLQYEDDGSVSVDATLTVTYEGDVFDHVELFCEEGALSTHCDGASHEGTFTAVIKSREDVTLEYVDFHSEEGSFEKAMTCTAE